MANKRLIYANVAKEMIVNHANEFSDVLNRREKALLIGGGTSCIDKCPTVDAVEVVHGRWIEKPYLLGTTRYCSVCGQNYGMPHGVYNYCPNCGAKIDGGNEDG